MLDLCSDLAGVALRPAQETTPHKPVALPAKTCHCKGHMPRKYNNMRKLPCFNDWSLIPINIHPKAKEDNKTASSNPDPVSSDDTATSTEVTAQNIKNGGSVIVNKERVNQFNIYQLELQKY